MSASLTPASNKRQTVRLHAGESSHGQVDDADGHLGDEAAMDAAETQVAAGNGYHQYLDDSPEDQLIEAWNNCPVTERYVLDFACTVSPNPSMTMINGRGSGRPRVRSARPTRKRHEEARAEVLLTLTSP
ncbi:hypothetical protein ACFY96_14185 [Streptomyces massasporeus]